MYNQLLKSMINNLNTNRKLNVKYTNISKWQKEFIDDINALTDRHTMSGRGQSNVNCLGDTTQTHSRCIESKS